MNKKLMSDMAFDMAKDMVKLTDKPSRVLNDEQWLYIVWNWCRDFLENYEARVGRMENRLRPSRN